MPLAYEHATSGKNATDDMRKVLLAFGAGSFGVMEDFDRGELIVQFEHRGRKVLIRANSKGYAQAWLKAHPWTPRMKKTKAQYERQALEQGQVSVYSILRDWIKGQVTAVEVGILSFEAAFLGQLMLGNGETVLERVEATKMLVLPAPASP